MTSNGKMYTMVMEKLNFEPRLDASNITVSVQGNHDIIVLGGKVSSYNETFIAEQAVKSLANVRTVVNEIVVDLATKYEKSDIEIAKDVTHILKSSVSVTHEHIQSLVKDEIVTLSGEVQWQYQKNNAFNAIRGLIGIRSIINKIVVKSPVKVDASKVKECIIQEFERHARIDADKIEVRVDGNKVILTGKLLSFREIDDAEDAAWSIPGVEIVENNITIGC
jgi:osmotically-inducible protein OsmY